MSCTDSNPVGTLQELAQKKGGTFPQYCLLQAVGESHCPNFTIEVRFGELFAEGTAANKKLAKHEAAKNMIALIEGQNESQGDIQEKTETSINQEKTIDETDLKPSAGNKVYSGNKIGELQEFCMGRGLGIPNYLVGETTGPPHMRLFTMICEVVSAKRVGAGGTKKESKRQAAGAVLEEISKPAENQDYNEHNLEETSCKDFEVVGMNSEQEEHQNNEEWEIIDGSKKFESDGDSQMEIPDMFEEPNKNILEDNTHENTPEETEE